jgi:hypothetical protein
MRWGKDFRMVPMTHVVAVGSLSFTNGIYKSRLYPPFRACIFVNSAYNEVILIIHIVFIVIARHEEKS